MTRTVIVAIVLLAASVQAAAGQSQPAAGAPPAAAAPQAAPPVSDRAVNPLEPDFTIIALPTTLRMPKFASAFRVTHRFNRPLGQGDFGDLLSDAFGIDNGALVGLEYRFGIWTGTQIGVNRTSDRTIEIFGQHQLLRQAENLPVSLDLYATIEGTNNFRDEYSPSVGVIVSRTIGRFGALYAHPIWVGNSNLSNLGDEDNTFIIGVGARLRLRPSVYVVGEAAPRFGFDPSHTYVSFGIEKRAGGHSFQLNFSTNSATTMVPIAQGGADYDTWFLGFNISRKFF